MSMSSSWPWLRAFFSACFSEVRNLSLSGDIWSPAVRVIQSSASQLE